MKMIKYRLMETAMRTQVVITRDTKPEKDLMHLCNLIIRIP